MIARYDARKRTLPVFFVLCASTFLTAPVWGQEPPVARREVKQEIKFVVRIHKQLIDDVITSREIVAAVPYNARVVGFHCEGVIDGRGKLAEEMSTENGDGTFYITSQGTAETCVRGVRGPIVALGQAWGSFNSSTTVRFDGRKFTRAGTTPWAEVHGQLEGIETRRGGRLGRAMGNMMLPVGRLLVPRAEREAKPIAEYYLTNFVNELADKIISRLNETTPVEASLNRLFPETTGWEFQLATTPDGIQAAYGPLASAVPVLPANPGQLPDTRLEFWLRSTDKNAESLEKLAKQPLAKPLIQAYLKATLPELANLTEERTVTAVGPWVVICVGKPKAAEPVEAEPKPAELKE